MSFSILILGRSLEEMVDSLSRVSLSSAPHWLEWKVKQANGVKPACAHWPVSLFFRPVIGPLAACPALPARPAHRQSQVQCRPFIRTAERCTVHLGKLPHTFIHLYYKMRQTLLSVNKLNKALRRKASVSPLHMSLFRGRRRVIYTVISLFAVAHTFTDNKVGYIIR